MKVMTVVLSEEADQCVRLFSLTQNIPISQVLRATVNKWIEDNGITPKSLRQELIFNLFKEWTKIKFISQTKLDDFADEKFLELRKKIPGIVAAEILQEFRQYEANSRKAPSSPSQGAGE